MLNTFGTSISEEEHKMRNVNGAAPGAPTWTQLDPSVRARYQEKLDAITGLDFETVCRRLDLELAAMKAEEPEKKAKK